MIITVTLNPAIDKTAEVNEINIGGLNRLTKIIEQVGGKGINVSKTLKQLNMNSIATGFVAGSNGKRIVDTLNELKIKNAMIEVDGNSRMNLKVLNHKMVLTEFNELGVRINHLDFERFKKLLLDLVKAGDIVVLAGSIPQGLVASVYRDLIDLLKRYHVKVLFDADGLALHEGLQASPYMIKPNVFELCQYFGVEETLHHQTIVALARQLLSGGVEHVIVSMGKEGAMFVTHQRVVYAAGIAVKAHSSVGAGDALVAAVAYALQTKMSYDDMIRFAIATSAGALLHEGTIPATYDEVKQLEKQVILHEWED